MTDEKKHKPITRKERAYVSLLFLFLIIPTVSIWYVFIYPYIPPDQSFTLLVMFSLVWLGLAGMPWLPVLFPRE